MSSRPAWIVLAAISACDQPGASSPPAGELPAEAPRVEANASSAAVPAGIVRGRFEISGPLPARPRLALDPSAGCGAVTEIESEKLIADNGRVANVLVRVVGGLSQKDWPAPATPALLDQTGCVYRPHVLAVQVGQRLLVRNGDPAVHNVNVGAKLNDRANFNRSHAPGSADISVEFDHPELSIPFRCDIHPWMQAWVHVVPHPFFDITGSDGEFEIRGLPPGRYELEYVHEVLGRQRFEAELSADAGAEFVIATRAK